MSCKILGVFKSVYRTNISHPPLSHIYTHLPSPLLSDTIPSLSLFISDHHTFSLSSHLRPPQIVLSTQQCTETIPVALVERETTAHSDQAPTMEIWHQSINVIQKLNQRENLYSKQL
ncbi:hypothetical protein LguiA_020063 [Lonicera macranthoides]